MQQKSNMNRRVANNRAVMGRGLYRRGMMARPGKSLSPVILQKLQEFSRTDSV